MFLSFSLFFVQRLVAQASRTDRTNPFSLAWFHSFVVIMTEKEKRPSALMLRRSKTFQLQQSSLRNPSASPKRRQQAFGKMLKGLALRIDSGGNMSAANVHLLKKAMSAPASVYLRPSTPSSPASPLSPMRNRRGTIVLHRLRPVDTKEKKKRTKNNTITIKNAPWTTGIFDSYLKLLNLYFLRTTILLPSTDSINLFWTFGSKAVYIISLGSNTAIFYCLL